MKNLSLLMLSFIFLLPLQGCFVTKSTHDQKVMEATMLRRELTESKKKNNVLSTEIEEISKTVDSLADELKKTKGALETKEKEVVRLKGLVEELQKTYDNTKISRETLINELLEKEKKYSSQIRDLTVRNTRLENEVKSVKVELENLGDQLEKAKVEKGELEKASSTVHLLEGRISRLKEEIADFLPLSGIRQKGTVALSGTYSSRFISREISFLFASIPLEAALESDGKKLSSDFNDFLTKLIELCENEKDCKLDIIATGRTYNASMDILNALKDKELLFLNAFDGFKKALDQKATLIRKLGRITIIDKINKPEEAKVEINIYLVRELTG